MFDLTYVDISGTMGLIATGLLTFNFLLGMMLSTAYKKKAYWKKLPEAVKKISIDDLHNWTAYVAFFFVVLHPLFLLLDKAQKFTLNDVLWPVNAPHQSNIVLLGTISFYALIIVIITTQKIVKKKMSFRLWKNIHLISYATALLFLIHGLLMDPLLKDRPVDWLDAEKFFSEFCLLLFLVVSVVRVRYHFKTRAN